MIFQHFNVFPHLTVLENITITPILELKTPKAQAEKEAIELLKKVGLEDKKDEYPRDRKSTRLNSSHSGQSRMPSSA